MTKSSATENDYVKHIANGDALPPYGSTLQINLHTADPGKAGTATSSPPTYSSYAPQVVARPGGLTVCNKTSPYAANPLGGAFKNTGLVAFPEYEAGFAGTETITHTSISVVATGQILRKSALNAPRINAAFSTPLFAPGEMIWAED